MHQHHVKKGSPISVMKLKEGHQEYNQLSAKLHPPVPLHSPPFIILYIVPQQSPCNCVTKTTTIIRSEMLCQEFDGIAATVTL